MRLRSRHRRAQVPHLERHVGLSLLSSFLSGGLHEGRLSSFIVLLGQSHREGEMGGVVEDVRLRRPNAL